MAGIGVVRLLVPTHIHDSLTQYFLYNITIEKISNTLKTTRKQLVNLVTPNHLRESLEDLFFYLSKTIFF